MHIVRNFHSFHSYSKASVCSAELGLHSKILVERGYRSGCCEEQSEASPISNRANASCLQDEAAIGQGWVQWRQW